MNKKTYFHRTLQPDIEHIPLIDADLVRKQKQEEDRIKLLAMELSCPYFQSLNTADCYKAALDLFELRFNAKNYRGPSNDKT